MAVYSMYNWISKLVTLPIKRIKFVSEEKWHVYGNFKRYIPLEMCNVWRFKKFFSMMLISLLATTYHRTILTSDEISIQWVWMSLFWACSEELGLVNEELG